MDKERIMRFLIKESLPHKLSLVLDRLTESEKTELKKFIKWAKDNQLITPHEHQLIFNHALTLQEVKESQDSLIELWDVTESVSPILARESETKLIYPIESYWLNHDLIKVNVSDYVPSKTDAIQMYGTQFELINPTSIQIGYFEVK